MCNHKKTSISRRDVLRYGAAGTTIAALGPMSGLLREASGGVATQNHMTILNLFGGNDGLNMVIPTEATAYAAYNNIRPTIAIDPQVDPVFPTNGNYVLHPSLPNLGQMYQDGDVAIVNLVGYPNPNLSHFTSEDIWSRGVRGSFNDVGVNPSGWIARFAEQYAPDPRSAVSIGVGQRRDFAGTSADPLSMSRLSSFDFDTDNAFGNNHQYRLDIAKQILAANSGAGASLAPKEAMDQAHTIVAEVQNAINNYNSGVAYDGSTPSRYMQDIARLVQAGFPTCLYYTGFGGFDTHGDQGALAGRQPNLFTRADNAIRSFSDDMKAMGVWNNTVIAVISEFGRRNFENGSQGTDHGHGNPVFFIGGGVTGGVYGPDVTPTEINQNWLPGLVDFRDLYREVMGAHLNVSDFSGIFPETQNQAPQTYGIM